MKSHKEKQAHGLCLKPQEISRREFYALLDGGAVVVTGSRRLCREIEAGYEREMQLTSQAWRTPNVCQFSSWLLSLWEDAVLDGALESPALLLSELQELRIWERILEKRAPDLLRSDAAAMDAMEAWRLMLTWRLPTNSSEFGYNEDSRAFWVWQGEFEAQCRRYRWLPLARLSDCLTDAMRRGWPGAPLEILLTGFDELTPQQQVFIDALRQVGSSVKWVESAGEKGTVVRCGWQDERAEIDAACCWARSRLEENPNARIGLVALDLAAVRQVLENRLEAVLAPELQAPGALGESLRPWNISLGFPLTRYPLVRLALQILQLIIRGRLPASEMSELLCSPELAGAEEEMSRRALLDKRLREQGETEVSLRGLAYFMAQVERPWHCPNLLCGVQRALQAKRDGNELVDGWARRFSNWLSMFGWAAGRSLDSDAYQTVQVLHEQLAAFGTLAPVTKAMPGSTALALLRRLTSGRIFQPQTPPAQVQVLGLYEAIGLEFDHLWIMGIHDNAWPAAPRPNPYLPSPLLRKLSLPKSGRERELRVARSMTERLCGAGTEVVMSYPLAEGEEILRPSPLLEGLPESGIEELGLRWESSWGEMIREHCDREKLVERAPSLAQRTARGGSRLFELQALCPFRAFAELRLDARTLAEPGLGLDAMQRGTLLHRTLERFWGDVESLERLVTLGAEGRTQAIAEAVEKAMDEAARRYRRTLQGQFLALERERLSALLETWLELEEKRRPFQVERREVQFQVPIGGIDVTLRIDRVDRLVDGGQMVIDYKSGRVAPGEWFGTRPDKPQLPLYAVALGEAGSNRQEKDRLVGVLYAQLRTGELGFKGVAEAGCIDGIPGSSREPLYTACNRWPEVVGEWRQAMERLAEEYRAGVAVVKPKQGLHTCRKSYCDLAPLCRIHEQLGYDAGLGTEDD